MKTQTLIAKCHSLAGNAAAGSLLMRIVNWMPRARREFGGYRWIAKSAADWCADTGLTPGQYRTAVARLRQRRLVVTEQHKFGDQTITHLRVTAAGRQALGWPPLPDQAAGQTGGKS